MSDYDDDDDEEESGGGGIQTDLVASYLAFVKRAISKRKVLVAAIFVVIAGLACFAAAVWPRTYHCESRMMATRSQVLFVRGDDWNDALRGVGDMIMRHENLEAMVKQTDLVRLSRERRPFITRVKESIMSKLGSKPPSDKDEANALVWTLESKLMVSTEQSSLTIAADWNDPQIAALLVRAAEDNFLEARHVAEISTVAEYISILEGHAARLRNEVDTIAAQIRQIREDHRNQARQKLAAKAKDTTVTVDDGTRRVTVRPKPTSSEPDEESARLKVMLDAKQRAIQDLEDNRNRRLVDLQNKLQDLQSKYTSAHPLVLDTRQNIASLSHESPQVTQLKAEVKQIESDMKRRSASNSVTGTAGTFGAMARPAAAANSEPLPSDVMNLLQESDEDLDPAVSAQFRYAVDKYSSLRGQIGSARVDLDTAQAAFKYRYKIVVPPEVPAKPTKPKVPVIIGGGIFGALIIALAVALLAELKSGKIVETWQVQQIALPLLAELRFPPAPSSSSTTPSAPE